MRGTLVLAVFVEGIGADRPAIGRARTRERSRHIAERIETGRQTFGEKRRGMRIAPRAQAKHHRTQSPRIAGNQGKFALIARESCGSEPARFARLARRQEFFQLQGLNCMQHNRIGRGGFGGGSKNAQHEA